jgi:alanine racemase
VTRPVLEIDLGAVVANWRRMRALAGPAEAAAVVKADAYGLGAAKVGRALAAAGCRLFYVAWSEEGAALRRAVGPQPEIRVFLGPTDADLSPFAVYGLTPVLSAPRQLAAWLAGAPGAPFALQLDTGMNRLGLAAADWPAAAAATRGAAPVAVLSHLACADEPAHPQNRRQLASFTEAAALWPGARRSLAASAGTYLGADFLFDEVRPGVALYGGGPADADGRSPQPVVTLTAPILQLRDVEAGAAVGYGASWTSPGPRRLATIGLGYADGFLRAAGNRGYGRCRDELRPLVGRVSMDLIVMDVTGLDARVGDAVELLGPHLSVGDQAAAMGTIDYELLTRLGGRSERRYRSAA